jgi:triphosphatase
MQPGEYACGVLADEVIELRLHVPPDRAAEVLDALPLSKRAKAAIRSQQLDSVYYDTADCRLHRRGLTLRLRQAESGTVQTLKAAEPDVALTRRREWEVPLSGPDPDLSRIENADVRAQCGLILPEELVPQVTASVARQAVRVAVSATNQGPAKIEVALDRGVIRGGAREVPVCDVELALKSGSLGALYALARRLNAAVPLRLEPASKADRGFALIADAVSPGVKASRIELPVDATVGECFHRICAACLAHWTANQGAMLDGRDPEGTHQMRVGLRRLRSALPLFRDALSEEDLGWLKAECGWAAGSLGDARNWDVFIGELLAPLRRARPERALDALAEIAEEQRTRAYVAARDAVSSARYTELVLRLCGWLEARGWRSGAGPVALAALDEPARTLADRLLYKQRKRALKRGRDFEALSAAERHQVRIALKRVRYSIEFFASLYPGKRVDAFLRALRAMQDDLGHLNDVATAQTMLDELLAGAGRTARRSELHRAAGLVIGWHARGVVDLEPKLVEDWHALRHAKPFWGS